MSPKNIARCNCLAIAARHESHDCHRLMVNAVPPCISTDNASRKDTDLTAWFTEKKVTLGY